MIQMATSVIIIQVASIRHIALNSSSGALYAVTTPLVGTDLLICDRGVKPVPNVTGVY